MKNPLNEEQINTLNKIAKLPADKQQEELQKLLVTLNAEQIEFLKTRQGAGNQCPFCLIKDGNISAKVVYKDDRVMAVLDINPASKGHVLLFPIKHRKSLNEVEDYGWFFEVAKNLGKTLLSIGAEGFNFYLANGTIAGQNVEHILLHIIPRYKDDELNFYWKAKSFSNEEMDKVLEEIISKLDIKEENVKELVKEKIGHKMEDFDFDESRIP